MSAQVKQGTMRGTPAREGVGAPRRSVDDLVVEVDAEVEVQVDADVDAEAGDGVRAPRDPRDHVVASQRPWGGFEQLATGEPVTVKILTVEPGHRLSLQRHRHRQELWQVLDGPLDVTVGDRSWSARPGERVLVPVGAVHRLGNSGDRAGRVLEVAFGHFDEDDIERLDDDYSR